MRSVQISLSYMMTRIDCARVCQAADIVKSLRTEVIEICAASSTKRAGHHTWTRTASQATTSSIINILRESLISLSGDAVRYYLHKMNKSCAEDIFAPVQKTNNDISDLLTLTKNEVG